MKGKLFNKVALVTGSGQGMGESVAKLFAQEGAKVVVNDINKSQAERVAEEIRKEGKEALAIQTDVTKAKEVSPMVETTLKEFKTIHILINNVGILRPTKIEEISEEEWNLVIDVNLKGTFLCSKAVLPIMKRNRYGKIVNFSSSAGKSVSTVGGAHYTAAKAGILGFTRHMAKEVAPYGINVNSVCPGLIDTEMVRANCSSEQLKAYEESFPISRLGTPEEVAQLVLFLVSNESSYITGASLDINGGDLMV
jgi:3-oxoacyl-[acyl-carrier protein] reductase